jgi:4-hydroxy-2-oxoheptanedioate aldolase
MPDWPGNLPRNAFQASALQPASDRLDCGARLCNPIVPRRLLQAQASTGSSSTANTRPNDVPSLLAQLQAMRGGTAEPVFRVPWNDAGHHQAGSRCGCSLSSHPFRPERGRSAARQWPLPAILRLASGESLLHRVPTTTAASGGIMRMRTLTPASWCSWRAERRSSEIEAIAAVEGVDGIFIGPSDLAADFRSSRQSQAS